MLWLAVLFEGGLIVVAWGLGALLGVPAFRPFHPTAAAAAFGVLATAPMLVGLAWADRSSWPPLVRFRRTVDEVVTPLFARCSVVDLAVVSVLAGVGEEVLFRGVIQAALVGPLGLWGAVVVTGVAFGLAHFVTATYAVIAAVIGIYLGVLLVAFDNLVVPVVAHALYDFVALTYLVYVRPPSGGPGVLEEGPPLSG